MRTRTFTSILILLAAAVPALAGETPRDEAARRKTGPARRGILEELDEARVNVELLDLEYQGLKNHLKQDIQMTQHSVFGFGMGGGMGGGAPFGRGVDPEEVKKRQDEMLASRRKQSEELRSATLEAGRKLRREQRRVAEIERDLGEPPAAGVGPGVERRLEEVEQKLDQVLKLLEKMKDSE